MTKRRLKLPLTGSLMAVASKRKGQLAPMENKPGKQEDILNAILQPREWVESGKHFVQYVSH